MSFLIVKSVPLSLETRLAWKQAGGTFLRRSRNGIVPEDVEERMEFVVNLGNVDFIGNGIRDVFNSPHTVRSISSAVALRETLGDFIPPRTINGPHWHKRLGFGGAGKVFHEDIRGECPVLAGDSQQHVDGTEYRVVTVGNMVVQAFEKDGVSGSFEYSWIGVKGVKRSGIIPLLKVAIPLIPGWERSIFGWDIIVGEGPYIIECNTSPGVNEFTVNRIVKQIRRVL